MSQHYYLVATLPLLFFENPPPFSSDNFLSFCCEQMSENEFEMLSRTNLHTLLSSPQDHATWQLFCSWETALRNELVRARASRLNISPDPYLHEADFNADTVMIVKEAFHADSPKTVEAQLDRARWRYLDELETNHHFDLGRLIVYRLKLLLLERKALFRPDHGLDLFSKTHTRVLQTAVEWTKPTAH